jgi:hypothetical protein
MLSCAFFCVRSLCAITLLRRCIVGNLNLRTFSLMYELCAVTVWKYGDCLSSLSTVFFEIVRKRVGLRMRR